MEYNTIWSFMIFKDRTSASSAGIWIYIHLDTKVYTKNMENNMVIW